MTHSSDNSSAKKLTSPVAITLEKLQKSILQEWIIRVHAEVKRASQLTAPILVNSIPIFMSNLAEALDERVSRETATDSNNIAQEHGGERARITAYGPNEVIQEYLILREVIVSKLEEKHTLNQREYSVIQKSFDQAIQHAMMAFYVVYNELRENVVSNLTHDMRTPLSAAKLTVDFISRKLSKPQTETTLSEVKGLLERVNKNIDYTNELIQNLLDEKYLKFEGHQRNFIAGEMLGIVDLAINDLSDDVKKLIKTSGESIKGYWDLKAFRRAIENLVSNAVKYGAEDELIEIKVSSVLGRLLVSVHNYGNPIPKEQCDLLFNTFHRADSAIQSPKKGWGLGLAFCREVAESHGGSLGIESNEENGTTFTIDVPVDARPMAGSPTILR